MNTQRIKPDSVTVLSGSVNAVGAGDLAAALADEDGAYADFLALGSLIRIAFPEFDTSRVPESFTIEIGFSGNANSGYSFFGEGVLYDADGDAIADNQIVDMPELDDGNFVASTVVVNTFLYPATFNALSGGWIDFEMSDDGGGNPADPFSDNTFYRIGRFNLLASYPAVGLSAAAMLAMGLI